MIRSRSLALSLCVILVFTAGFAPLSARAGESSREEGERLELYASVAMSPIGTIESSGEILINGRAAYGKELVWEGELLQAPARARARVSLTAIGKVTLRSGALIKLATAATEMRTRRVLVATLISGEVEVKLQPSASAYLQIAGSAFAASSGASFRASVREGSGVVEAAPGVIQKIGGWAIKFPPVIGKTINRSVEGIGNWAVKVPALMIDPSRKGAQAQALSSPRQQLIHALGIGFDPGRELSHSVRLDTPSIVGAIGRAESLTAMRINGRVAHSKELIWDGELLEAPAESSVRVALDAIGQITLSRGTIVRLNAARARLDGRQSRRVLVATLIRGEVSVKLQPEAGAYIQAGRSSYAASAGATFRIGAHDGQAMSEAASGVVQDLGNWTIELATAVADTAIEAARAQARSTPPRYFVRPLVNPSITVKARSTRQIQIQVTDENDRRVPDLPVIFLLNGTGGPQVGSFSAGTATGASVTVNTNAQGIATATYQAGDNPGSISYTVMVQGTTYSWTGLITVVKFVPGFWTVQNALPVFATAALGVTMGLNMGLNKDDSKEIPVKLLGPPVIKP